jgi:hypothetical protein
VCHGNYQEETERKVSQSDAKKWPVAAEKSGVLSVVHLGLRLRAQKDAETKVTSLGDYLFFAPIGL